MDNQQRNDSTPIAPGQEGGATDQALPVPLARGLLRGGVFLAGFLYTIGLLIVNLDLGGYGLVPLELARSEYVLAGSLWAVVVVSGLALIALVRVELPRVARHSNSRLGQVLWVLVELYSVGWLLYFVLNTLSRGQLSWTSRQSLIPLLCIVWNVLALFLLIRALTRFKGGFSLVQVFEGRVTKAPGFLAMMLLSGLALYAVYVFPVFPREFGGGARPRGYLLLNERLPIPWDEHKIATADEGRRVGPVRVLLEKDGALTVAAVEDTNPGGWLPAAATRHPAVRLDSAKVLAILYKPSFGERQ